VAFPTNSTTVTMPSRSQPKILSLMIKSHKLSIILTAAQTMSISALKEEVLSALQSHPDELLDIPEVKTVKDFELSRELKEKGKPTGNYDVLRSSEKVKDNLVNWDTIYIQFLNDSGKLNQVEFTPVLVDEDEVQPSQSSASPPVSSVVPGKRKAPEA